MNDFNKLLTYANENKKELSALYDDLDNDYIKKASDICGFKNPTKAQKIAILRRIVDLKVDPLLNELEKKGYSEDEILNLRDEMFDFTALVHENLHRNLILKAKENRVLNEFNLALIDGVHKIGLVMNKLQKEWQHSVVDKNVKKFSKMSSPKEFIKENKLYQKTPRGEKCDRAYGVVEFSEDGAVLKPYASFFKEGFVDLEAELDNLIDSLNLYAINIEEKNYIEYFKKLKAAFMDTNNETIISSWRDAEMAWMNVKSELQVGHPLEYYEDAYTHAVAFEWDIRLKEDNKFNEEEFKKNIKNSFDEICSKISSSNEIMKSMVHSNIDKTQLYISTPMIYYGAELDGLFSAQVVPNDEFVSGNSGKKIFAFINHVYKSIKSRPYMKISSEVFEEDYLEYGREILKKKPEIWKRVYEVSTIGHEFGHMFFIDYDTEELMNRSGVFKFIEEYKATTGGLINFFYNEEDDLILPVFDDLIRRSVGLISWQEVESVRAYYCEALIHLTLLFESEVLEFKDGKLRVDFTKEGYERFKERCMQNYKHLAIMYDKKMDAKVFLDGFCEFMGNSYLPTHSKTKEFVEYYHDLYKKIGNEVEE
ncbi:invasion antigen B [Campylobacter blaseri]|uniref:DUF7897 domain-containing protein n=1 Tax=Campylobacter blaseri TaxID=2042961 RepID=A0A2P8R183_9BACT|nr:invasion protein CiaB [Campylobacter blaseri]PSM52256.1 hypothetical protein CQ405_04155 [Campylobacter blaseri]PSM54022.1 hypothetical protein CRN67_04155 [Campylobacter blaseri]QKF85460.1 invasion antigen B [Campylobacter blaseri]